MTKFYLAVGFAFVLFASTCSSQVEHNPNLGNQIQGPR